MKSSTTRRNALANELKLFQDQVQAESLRFEEMTEEMRSWKETRHAERISLSSMRRELESELIRAAETLALHDQRALKLKRLEKKFDSVRSAGDAISSRETECGTSIGHFEKG